MRFASRAKDTKKKFSFINKHNRKQSEPPALKSEIAVVDEDQKIQDQCYSNVIIGNVDKIHVEGRSPSKIESKKKVGDRESKESRREAPEVASPSDSIVKTMGFENFDSFMDFVAFPEKHMSLEKNCFEWNQLQAVSPAESVAHSMGFDNFDSFMDYVAFPEKHMFQHFPGDGKVVVTIFKKTKFEPLSIQVKRKILTPGIFIWKINENSKLADTDMEPGMKIIAINGQSCPPTVDETKTLLGELEGHVTFLCEPEKPKDYVRFMGPGRVQSIKENPRTPMKKQVLFSDSIKNIDASNDNKKGGNTCAKEKSADRQEEKNRKKRSDYFNCMEEGISEKMVSRITTKRKNERFGLLLRKCAGGDGIRVLKVCKGSIFANSGLKAGMKIHYINGKQCPDNVAACTKLIREIGEDLEIICSEFRLVQFECEGLGWGK
jgi:hypothetical protein